MALSSEKNIVGNYQLGKVMGTGDFDCTIRSCTHITTGLQRAVRVYSKQVLAEKGSWQQLADAVQVVRTLPRSERIVETVECFETASYLYILMAFAPGISLYKLLVLGPSQYQPHPPTTSTSSTSAENNNNNNSSPAGNNKHADLVLDLNDKRIIFLQVLQGLQHLHSHDVAHMGLAPDHILIHWDRGGSQSATKFSVRIGFLVACKKVEPGQKMSHLCGTTHTIAPEVLRQTEAYDPFLADIWSAGVVLYFMLSGGKYPFDGANTSKHILAHDVRPLDPAIPQEAKQLVHHMMHPDPNQRPTLAQVIDNAWLNNKTQMSSKSMLSVIQNAVTAKRDDASGKIIVRVMPLMFPRKELAARVIQAVWRLVHYRPLHRLGGPGRSASMMKAKKDKDKERERLLKEHGVVVSSPNNNKDGEKKDETWGETVESGSDESGGGDGDDDEDDDDLLRGGGADDDEEDEHGNLLNPAGGSMLRRSMSKRLKQIIAMKEKSTVPPMPPTLIAHDVRCHTCGRVPPTTFQPGKHPFQNTHYYYKTSNGFQDRDEMIRQQQIQQEQEMLAQVQHHQQQLFLLHQQQQQQLNQLQRQQSGQNWLQTPPPLSLGPGPAYLPDIRQGGGGGGRGGGAVSAIDQYNRKQSLSHSIPQLSLNHPAGGAFQHIQPHPNYIPTTTINIMSASSKPLSAGSGARRPSSATIHSLVTPSLQNAQYHQHQQQQNQNQNQRIGSNIFQQQQQQLPTPLMGNCILQEEE
jgi:serine/threonine protein kinase